MLRIISSSIVLAGVLLFAGQPAEAHGARHQKYQGHGHHHRAAYRHGMPRWLWKKKGFRRWYHRTPQRLTNRLTWPRLYNAYRWERRHDFRRSYWRNFGHGDRRYDRGYGRDYDQWDRRPRRNRNRH